MECLLCSACIHIGVGWLPSAKHIKARLVPGSNTTSQTMKLPLIFFFSLANTDRILHFAFSFRSACLRIKQLGVWSEWDSPYSHPFAMQMEKINLLASSDICTELQAGNGDKVWAKGKYRYGREPSRLAQAFVRTDKGFPVSCIIHQLSPPPNFCMSLFLVPRFWITGLLVLTAWLLQSFKIFSKCVSVSLLKQVCVYAHRECECEWESTRILRCATAYFSVCWNGLGCDCVHVCHCLYWCDYDCIRMFIYAAVFVPTAMCMFTCFCTCI